MSGIERHYLGAAPAELVSGARVGGLGRPFEGVSVALKLAKPLTAGHNQTLGGVEHLSGDNWRSRPLNPAERSRPVTTRHPVESSTCQSKELITEGCYTIQPLRNCKTALQFRNVTNAIEN